MWYHKFFYSAYVSIISNHSKVVKNINQLLLVIKLLLFYCHYNGCDCDTKKVCVVYSVVRHEVNHWVIFTLSHLQEVYRYFDPH